MILMWWSDGLHAIVEDELGDNTLGDIGVGTQGYSGLVTLRIISVDTQGDSGLVTLGIITVYSPETQV